MYLRLFRFPVFIGAFCYVIVTPFLQIILHVFLPALIVDVSVISVIGYSYSLFEVFSCLVDLLSSLLLHDYG